MEEIRERLSKRADEIKKATYPGQAEWLERLSQEDRAKWFDLLFDVEALEEEDRALPRSLLEKLRAVTQ